MSRLQTIQTCRIQPDGFRFVFPYSWGILPVILGMALFASLSWIGTNGQGVSNVANQIMAWVGGVGGFLFFGLFLYLLFHSKKDELLYAIEDIGISIRVPHTGIFNSPTSRYRMFEWAAITRVMIGDHLYRMKNPIVLEFNLSQEEYFQWMPGEQLREFMGFRALKWKIMPLQYTGVSKRNLVDWLKSNPNSKDKVFEFSGYHSMNSFCELYAQMNPNETEQRSEASECG